MAMNSLRVGIVGCGWVSTGHMNGYLNVDGPRVVAVADKDSQRMENFCKEWEVAKGYTDYREMLEHEDLDIVSICTWPAMHCEMTVEAARQGAKGILCEKPMALSLSEARRMIDACLDAKCNLLVSHQRRFEARYLKAKELVSKGEIGELLRMEAFQGDLFTDDHCIDLTRFLNGDFPVSWVMGQVDWVNRGICGYGHPVEDSAIGLVKFENGVECHIVAGRVRDGHFPYSFILNGTEGVMEISGCNHPADSWIKVLGTSQPGWRKVQAPNGLLGTPRTEIMGRPTIEYYWVDSWKRQAQAVVDAVEKGDSHGISGSDALRSLEIVAAIYESSRSRTVVRFPLSSGIDRPLEAMEEIN